MQMRAVRQAQVAQLLLGQVGRYIQDTIKVREGRAEGIAFEDVKLHTEEGRHAQSVRMRARCAQGANSLYLRDVNAVHNGSRSIVPRRITVY